MVTIMKKKFLFSMLIAFVICNAGCEKRNTVSDISQLPDIVFLDKIWYAESRYGIVSDNESPKCAMAFYDKNGNHYISTDESVCYLSFEQLVEEYTEGELADKISYHTNCDTNELLENYNKLCELSRDDFHLVDPEYGPDVLADLEVWYGLYYDQDGKIQSLRIHRKEAHGDQNADDERANEIYQWYINSFES